MYQLLQNWIEELQKRKTMDSEKVLEWHKKDFKFYGVWPRENPTVFQFVHALLFYTIFIVMFTVSAVICVFFCNSIDAMVDNLLLSTTFVMVSIKAFNMLATKRTFFNVFRTLKELDATVTTDEHRQIFVPIFERSAFIFKCIFVQFLVNGILIVAQVLLSKPELRILSSTYLYPGEFWHNPIIYNAGIYFQLISCIFQATLDSAFDTYVGALLDLLDGHITALGRRFRALGNLTIEAELKLSVILACKKYVLILECRQLLERALSVTLFTQFGVNGLVLCTCAYQLSMVGSIISFWFIFRFIFNDFSSPLDKSQWEPIQICAFILIFRGNVDQNSFPSIFWICIDFGKRKPDIRHFQIELDWTKWTILQNVENARGTNAAADLRWSRRTFSIEPNNHAKGNEI